ncbi:hypothetical protein [Hyalangium minutum]|uniref:Cytochrome c domain-containing protein n=1 Tax=Hyalangium minutum TaxID=394096 RepID=A0A085WIK3_9BACT|nr:hypothetical protein [Hyalangium minutum]KFE67516.1 hypothetical protein DB31_7999 [Hyalangium minutum]
MHLQRVSFAVLGLSFCLLAAGCDSAPPEVLPAVAPEEALHSERGGIGTSSQALLSSSPRTIDPRRSLAVTDESILAQFSFQSVMQQLVTQAGVAGVDRMTLFRQLWDTQNPAPGLNLGPHCDDVRDGALQPIFNGYPIDCPRAEGLETQIDPFSNPTTNAQAYIPIGLFNRFDLAPASGANCGEYRIAFGKRGGFGRNLLIFEAVLPNPHPEQGLEGCRPVVEFWAGLSTPTRTSADRATALRNFYFTGLAGFLPVIHLDNYGNRATGATGQLRTNQFMDSTWNLREFKLKKTCGTSCTLRWMPATDKTNPAGTLFDPASPHALADDFRAAFLATEVSRLALNDINRFNMVVADKFNSGQSEVEFGGDTDYDSIFGGASAFRTSIQSKLTSIGSTLTPDHIVRRAQALSCAGCHQLSNGRDLGFRTGSGSTIPWPNSLGFTHVSEQLREPSPDGGNRFVISPALTDVFLPHRKQVFEDFLNTLSYTFTGAVGISGSDMVGPNRLTKGPCTGQPFTTPDPEGATLAVTNSELGTASWDCAEPNFWFGSNLGRPLSPNAATQAFTFKPPAGYTCDGYDLYGPYASHTFSKSGNNCTLSITLGTPGDLFLWFYVKPTLAYKVSGAVAIDGSDAMGANRVTQGPCAGKPFITGSTTRVNNAQLLNSRWDCVEPSFWFGDVLGQRVSLSATSQSFTYTPPAGFACTWYGLYGDKTGESFTRSGNNCTLTLQPNAAVKRGELFLWFFVQPL